MTEGRAMLFTGHMIDRADRAVPRFPAACEPLARSAIADALDEQLAAGGGLRPVISGGACGGDIIFHELCHERGVATELYLALEPERFRATSVSFAGPGWDRRFDHLLDHQPTQVLDPDPDSTVWEQANQWMLTAALDDGPGPVTLIALWDGRGGDGVGGTEHFVARTRAAGGDVVVLDTVELFGLG